MKTFHAVTAALVGLLVSAAVSGKPAPSSARVPEPVRSEQVAIGPQGERMALQIWRPGGAGGPYPLVVFSHGTGAGPAAHIDTAEALASAGFVVAAPMHRGDNFQDDSNVGQPDWMISRSRDVSAAIDYMVQQWDGHRQIDQSRVGVFGFSAGATAALIVAGGVPDMARVKPHCAIHPEFVCKLFAPQAASRELPATSWSRDSRVAAVVIAAPGLGFTFEPSGLAAVTVPIQLWSGAADQTVPYATNAGVVRRLLPGRVDFRSVEKAVHLSFLAPCGPDSPPQLCDDIEGFNRADFHREFNRSIVEFFDLHLRGAALH